jgi:hypothetical protein
MKRTLVFSLVCTLILAATTGTAGAGPVKVLHVSEVMQSEVQTLIDDTGMGSLFDVTQVSYWDEYHNGPPENLPEYDVIVFGLSDCLDVVRDLDELYWFVDGGGGVVFTHDSAANINPLAVRDMVGMGDWIDPDPPAPDWVWGNSAEIIKDHVLLHYPFEIGNVGEGLEIQRTHTVVLLESGDKILKLPGPDDSSNWYLSAKRFGAGRIVVSQIGHSVYQCAGEPGEEDPAPREQELFVNCLYWVGRDHIELCVDLISQVEELGLPKGAENSLVSKLENALDSIGKGQTKAAVNKLEAFINEVEAQQGKKIPQSDADALIAAAQYIIAVIESS